MSNHTNSSPWGRHGNKGQKSDWYGNSSGFASDSKKVFHRPGQQNKWSSMSHYVAEDRLFTLYPWGLLNGLHLNSRLGKTQLDFCTCLCYLPGLQTNVVWPFWCSWILELNGTNNPFKMRACQSLENLPILKWTIFFKVSSHFSSPLAV